MYYTSDFVIVKGSNKSQVQSIMIKVIFTFILSIIICTATNANENNYRNGFTTKAKASVFIDSQPGEQYVIYGNQYCRKTDRHIKTIAGKKIHLMKVICRQQNGEYAYVK